MEEAISRKTPEKDCVDTKEKGNPNSQRAKKKLQDQGHTRRTVRGCLWKKQKETGGSGRKECENRRVIIITRHMTATKP